MVKYVMYFAMFVGAIVIAAWVSREASYFFNSIIYQIRYNWMPFLAGAILVAIAFKVFSSKA